MKKSLIFLAAAAMVSLNAEVLWKADFTKDLGGFAVVKQKAEDSVRTANGELVMQFTGGVNKGIEFTQEIPFPEKGDLVFDAVVNDGNKGGYGAWSLKMGLFGKLIAWNGSPNMGLCLYSPNTPPTNWISVSKIPNNKKVTYRFRFDRTKGTLDVFVDGALIPQKSFKDIKYAEPKSGKGILRFGNYGYASGKLTHKISDLRLETVSDNASVTEPKVVWSEKFEKDGSLLDNGYKQYCDNKKDQITVRDGVLTLVCQNSPYKGSGFTKEIPGVLRGELTFEASTGSGLGYNHYSLSMGMGGMSFSWRANNAWHLYHPKENKWHPLTSRVSNGEWHKYKICFDAAAHTAEFFVDDMDNPVFIDEKSEYIPTDKVVFRINNYGLCSGTIVNKLRNIELKAVPEKKNGDGKSLKGTMVFRGISDTFWPLKKLVAGLGEKDVTEFVLQLPPHHTKNDNVRFDLQPKPSPSKGPAKYIILADMPSTPIPPYTMKMIRQAVEDGGKLIILDGMFTLQKGEYAGTLLEEILPVSVKNKWGSAAPLPGAEVFKHNGKDAVVSRTVGKGKVYVVLGNAIKDPSVTDVLDHYSFK